MLKTQDMEKPQRNPPSAWNKKIVLVNNPENFPKIPETKKPKT
jgi:hypothetical protein